MAELAVANAKANGFSAIGMVTDQHRTAFLPRLFDHAIANPSITARAIRRRLSWAGNRQARARHIDPELDRASQRRLRPRAA